jgi:hypothetical protein
MSFRTRITRTLVASALAATSAVALAGPASAVIDGPDVITNPTPCTHGCGGGGGFDGPDDFKNPDHTPTDPTDPHGEVEESPDAPIVVARPTFTG